MAEGPEPPFDSFQLATGTGWYRVRAHAVGRSLDFDVVVTENPREEHLLQLWRTDGFAPARHHRIDDQWANQGTDQDRGEWDEPVDQLAGLDPVAQRRVAHWAASRACELVGGTALDWRPALEALREGRPMPPPFDDPAEAWARLHGPQQAVAVASDGVDVPVASHPADAALAALLLADSYPIDAIVTASGAYEDPEVYRAAVRDEVGRT